MDRVTANKNIGQRSQPVTLENLEARCRDRGLTVTELARRIRRSRTTVYFALERPSRYSLAYHLIQNELA